jgi:HK97 family phage major capsid protein
MEKLDEIKTVIEVEFKKLDEQRDADKKAAAALIKEVQDKLDAESKSRLAVEKAFDDFRKEQEAARRRGAFSNPVVRPKGMLSEKAAGELGALFILQLHAKGKLEGLNSNSKFQDGWISEARSILGIEAKAALTTTDMALPISYTSELRQLLAEYGVARRVMTRFPIGAGSYRPPRTGTMDDFGFIAMSAADLASHKVGGIVRIPREIDEQSVVAIGQYIALHGAQKFAKKEDDIAFLADGSGTYESISGIGKVCDDNAKTTSLDAGETSPSQAALADFRALQEAVHVTARIRGRYYMNNTWRSRLRTFKTQADPTAYDIVNGQSFLDGYPIEWVEIMQPFSTSAQVSKYLAFFGDLTWWWFGEHGVPRIDTSADVYFTTDELGVRFIEEIDVDYNTVNAMAALKTPAS